MDGLGTHALILITAACNKEAPIASFHGISILLIYYSPVGVNRFKICVCYVSMRRKSSMVFLSELAGQLKQKSPFTLGKWAFLL